MTTDAAADIAAAGQRKRSERSGRPQSTEIDQTILKATLDVLADVGFDALSLAEVARRAGSTIPAIYRRHADKHQLVLAALKSELAELPIGVTDTGNLRDDLLDLAQRIATALTARRARLFAGLVLARRDNPELLDLLSTELHRIAVIGWQEVITRAVGRGEALNDAVASSILDDLPGAYLLGKTLLEGRPPEMRHLEAMIDKVMLPALLSSQDNADRS
ncbi:Transcriptional regulator protein [Novosphingobium sp. Rr 2-17]|uniref:TetR/AcrR family transcriptional regulator n=1 Tax=Novosphingobium sp. Rr 2-17 TaxID=555793 RepID=UPI0002697B8E|nr:TetR/AcrR family transcriptional regulator [Novosphingobium sp. Rr 2-17]EIZ78314.1 Transcriptional regulator protein [Novosphingobium sp. Rr 2-17]